MLMLGYHTHNVLAKSQRYYKVRRAPMKTPAANMGPLTWLTMSDPEDGLLPALLIAPAGVFEDGVGCVGGMDRLGVRQISEREIGVQIVSVTYVVPDADVVLDVEVVFAGIFSGRHEVSLLAPTVI
jgi:hypothetical protein